MSATSSKTEQTVTPLVSHMLFGRRKIYTSVSAIAADNVVDIVTKAYNVHLENRREIQYLYEYYKGKQPILDRIKEIRPEICNNIVVNRANEIVAFKVGYQCGIPMQYTAAKAVDGLPSKIEDLNNLMAYESKALKDKELVEWQMICGTGYRIVLPDDANSGEEDEAPFSISTLRPTDTFVIYSDKIGEKPMAAITYWVDDEYTGELEGNGLQGYIFAVYTEDSYYELKGNQVTLFDNNSPSKPNTLKMIPIIEYPANNARLGAFEIVIDLLDALSKIESNRLDGLESFVQAFIKFVNCDIDMKEYEEFLAMGAIKVSSREGKNADVDLVSKELSQTQAQVEVDDLYDTILTICGMPNRNGGSSTSDTGAAVQLRDGWSSAEARAKESELMFEASERELLKIVLKILRDKSVVNLKVSDIQMVFPRRNYENVQGKVQALTGLLASKYVHIKDAYAASGLFTDPETASENGMKWYEEQVKQYDINDVGDEDKNASKDNNVNEDNDVSGSGQTTE